MTRWALLVGGKGTGRSLLASRLARELSSRGISVRGVVQEEIEEEQVPVGHDVRRVGTDDRMLLARRGATPREPSEEAFCSFVFDRRAFDAARGWIEQDAATAQVLIVDEVSKLEAAGGGHHDAIVHALAGTPLVVLSVRSEELFAVMERFALDEPVAMLDTADAPAFAAFVDSVATATIAAEG
jgi:nucleoside-triphosphatase THEP1